MCANSVIIEQIASNRCTAAKFCQVKSRFFSVFADTAYPIRFIRMNQSPWPGAKSSHG